METQPPVPALYALMIESAADDSAALDLCRDHGFLGVGWGVGHQPLDWEGYEQRAIERNGAVHAAVREIYELPVGALIWARARAGGDYYLAKVTGPWRYLHGPDADKTGMHNVRPVEMVAFDAASKRAARDRDSVRGHLGHPAVLRSVRAVSQFGAVRRAPRATSNRRC